MTVCAGITLYNPDIERLTQNVNAVLPQVDLVIFVDNASDNIDELQKAFTNDKFAWIKNDTNLGIAGALNQLIDYSHQRGYEWILTLDQDSICGNDLVQKLLDGSRQFENTAMVSPRIVDRHLSKMKRPPDEIPPVVEEISMCITSGCLTNVKMVFDEGGFNERLFIDQVDFDMCLRLKRRGYRIIKVNAAELLQEYGKKTVFRKVRGRTIICRGYSPTRVYYQTRNQLYMVRKYGYDFSPSPKYYFFHAIIVFGVELIYESKRIARLIAFIRGYLAGLFMKI